MLTTTSETVSAFAPPAMPAMPAMPAVRALYANAADRSHHMQNVAQLALETACPVNVIEPLYEQVLEKLQKSAKVKDYLPILVTKGVKKALKKLAKQQH